MSLPSERRLLQIVLGALLFVPLGLGPYGAVFGLSGFERVLGVQVGPFEPNLDSDFRFLSAAFMGLGLVVASTLRRVEREGRILRLAIFALFLGGLARLVSWHAVGAPNALTGVLIGIELALPLLALWQTRVARAYAREGA